LVFQSEPPLWGLFALSAVWTALMSVVFGQDYSKLIKWIVPLCHWSVYENIHDIILHDAILQSEL
jgi:hypothetical protein